MIISYQMRDEIPKRFAFEIASKYSIQKIILYGSTARKDDRIDSDIDIAIIGEIPITLKFKEEINDIITDYLLNYQIFINWIFFSKSEWDENILPIIQIIHREGKILWEKEKI